MAATGTFPRAAGPRGLRRGEVHIRHAQLESLAGMAQELLSILSPDERLRAESFRFQKDRDRFAMSRGILRKLLGEYLGVSPKSLQFYYGVFGKPYLLGNSVTYPMQFSVSHSCDLVLLGFSRDQEIGVDLERIRTDFDFENLAKRFLSPGEFSKLISLTKAESSPEFFRLWTRMEAYAKARGIGMSLWDGPEVSWQHGENSVCRTACHSVGRFSGYKIEEFSPEPNYIASVASTFAASRLKLWKYPCFPRQDSAVYREL